jgi:hypothetical protein
MPSGKLGHQSGSEGANERGNHPRGRECGEDFRVQYGRIDPGHHDVEGHGQGASTQALHQPAGDQRGHGPGRSGDQQAEHEQGHRREQGTHRTTPVGPVARHHHADDAGGERTGEGQGVQRCTVQLAADERHDGGYRHGFEGGQEHQGTGAKGHQQVVAVEETG